MSLNVLYPTRPRPPVVGGTTGGNMDPNGGATTGGNMYQPTDPNIDPNLRPGGGMTTDGNMYQPPRASFPPRPPGYPPPQTGGPDMTTGGNPYSKGLPKIDTYGGGQTGGNMTSPDQGAKYRDAFARRRGQLRALTSNGL